MKNALEIKSLSKTFGKNQVLNGLTFNVPKNSILGLLGRNGAGKTTTMNMILGFLKIDSGSIKIFNEEVHYGETSTNKYIGYLPDVPEFYGYMTPKEYLQLCGEITGLSKSEIRERSHYLLQLVGLEKYNKKIRGFSRGMKQRLGIAQALLNQPKILICDEPTSALDPSGRKEILEIIKKIRGQTTVIFSTHILSDVEAICDHVIILNKGKNVLSGEISKLKEIKRQSNIEIKFFNLGDKQKFLHSDKIIKESIVEENNTIVIEGTDENQRKAIMREFYNLSIFPEEMRVMEASLEDIFLEVTRE
ncbi:ABC transporter ATP-binding protein [Streptococcus pacificus]|uniref:ABC transporter ATP-binding protein n=1 Tax=Streptococcus pacificus TaxID=2740577 RepID=A0ABS0ZHU1_9STRE|nr:ABC transporter ATP-binding protein [Streptococcus pacificus]MBJ8325559.1 ABC transporter ATP-binding protein [Streptococcus pacificus]